MVGRFLYVTGEFCVARESGFFGALYLDNFNFGYYYGHSGISCNAWNDSAFGSVSNYESFMLSEKVTSALANARASPIVQLPPVVLQSLHVGLQK